MSTLAYNEPYKYTALLATLVIHALFFALLYFGVSWQVREPEGMEVEIWNALPETESRPAPSIPAPPPEPARQAAEPALPAKPDIDLAEKKKKTAVKPKETEKPAPAKKLSKAERKRMEAEARALEKQQELADQRDLAARAAQAARAARAAEAQAAAAAAISSEVGKYIGLIRSKIRNNLTMPPDVEDDALAEYEVTLLPDGSVLDVKELKSSGNAAYDSAVERAIKKAEPLPLPQNEEARRRFVNPSSLRLKFSPKDKR